jgi:hypothetical protein
MNDRQDIDAGIDAALAAQVRAPRLDRQFDAAVWRRIAVVADQPARSAGAPARRDSAIHWLRAGNVAGLLVAVVLAGYYGFQQFGSSIAPEVLVGPAVESGLPWMSPMAWVVTVCALAFGLKFTAVGKWLG